MLTRSSVGIGTVALIGAMIAGCPGGPTVAPISGNANLGLVGLLYDEVGANHSVGSTACPTPAGTITLTNHSTTDSAVVDIAGAGGSIELWVDTASGSPGPFTPTTLAPGEDVVVRVVFNCASTEDVDVDLTISATVGTMATETHTIPLTVDVIGG